MYISVKQAAEKWDISDRRVRALCENGQVEGAMNPVFEAIDQKFGTEMGYDSEFCTRLCEDIEEQLEEWIDYNSDNGEDEE